MEKYIMALDQGTTSSRCILYDKNGKVVSVAQKEFKQIYPQNGWVEHDPMEIWSVQLGVAQEAMYKINCTYNNIDSIGITNQRETTVVWDKKTGNPITNAIVWQCRRTAKYCDKLKEDKELKKSIREKTGLLIDAYFSGTKLKWILENVPGAKEKAKKGELLFGTIETWLIWKLTSGRVHITDYSNASRTMLFNINTLKWDDDILKLLDIPKNMLPTVEPSSKIYGMTDEHIFGGEIPIAGAAGDQQASLFGLTCFEEGECKMTYGTGGFMLMNTGNKLVRSENGLITTIAWGIDGNINYALEGSIFVAGAVIQWLRDELGIIKYAKDSEEMAKTVPDTNGVVFVPAFAGLGAPYWDPYARGSLFGITRGTRKEHIVRAALESMAYQTRDLSISMEEDCKSKIKILKVDGGAAANDFILQFQADILDVEVNRPKGIETTSLGVAYLAGLATGYWKDKKDILDNYKVDKRFIAKMEKDRRRNLIDAWRKGINRSMKWMEEDTLD